MPLHHELTYATIFARGMGVMRRFYADVLGLEVRYPDDTSALGEQEWVTFGTGTCQRSLHAGGEAAPCTQVAKGRDPEGNRFSICEINHDHGGDG